MIDLSVRDHRLLLFLTSNPPPGFASCGCIRIKCPNDHTAAAWPIIPGAASKDDQQKSLPRARLLGKPKPERI